MEGQSIRIKLGETEGRSFTIKLVPASVDDVEGQGIRSGHLRPDEDGTEGQKRYALEPDDGSEAEDFRYSG